MYEQFLVAEHGYFLMTTIHMPAFFFISGCLAKNSDTLPRILGRFCNLGGALAFFQIVYVSVLTASGHYSLIQAFASGLSNYWFVCVMMAITVGYPLLRRVRIPGFPMWGALLGGIACSTLMPKAALVLGYCFCYSLGNLWGKGLLRANSCRIGVWPLSLGLLVLIGGISVLYEMGILNVELLLRPAYRSLVGCLLTVVIMLLLRQLDGSLFVEGGRVSLQMYLIQFPLFRTLEWILPDDRPLLSWAAFGVMSAVSYCLPIWLHKRFGDSKPYRLVFRVYDCLEPWLPRALTGKKTETR